MVSLSICNADTLCSDAVFLKGVILQSSLVKS